MDIKRCVSNFTMLIIKLTLCVCLLAHMVCLLPVVPDSVHNRLSRSLPNQQPSPLVSGREIFVQYSPHNKPSGFRQLAKHIGAQHKTSIPQSAKQVDSNSYNRSPGYANENIVNSTHIRSSRNLNSTQLGKHSKNSRSGGLKTKNAQIPRRNSLPLQYESESEGAKNSLENINTHVNVKFNALNDDNKRVEHDMRIENSESLQLAVRSGNTEVNGQTEVSDTMLAVASGVVALFSLGVIIGIFSCCCKKKAQNVEEEKLDMLDKDGNIEMEEEDPNKVNNERSLADSKKPSEVFNSSGIPEGEKDLDDNISFKDKIKALDNKLIIQPSPDKRKSLLVEQAEKRKSQLAADQQTNRLSQHSPDVATKRKSQNEANMVNSITGLPKQPKIVVSEDDDVKSRDKDGSKSAGDNISKSDTQDDISDKIFDNLSMHSSTSQPFNPDVVIADSDDDEEFGEIQRGTSILKSFQRAKPPRNRSPATRTSKGKIRKPRPNARNQGDVKDDREPTSTPSSASVPFSMATSDSKTNSLDKSETKVLNNTSKNNSLEKVNERKKSIENNFESPMSKSSNFSDFDSVMSQSITSVGSDIVTPMKRDPAKNGKFAKTKKDSPKRDRKESPARVTKSKEREITEKDKRNDSPSRFKKSKDSPVEKRKNRKKDDDRQKNRLSTDIGDDKAGTNSSKEKRLSGVPVSAVNNASNNIFYLIDPTVKDKCKSVGDVTRDKRTSGDYSKHAQKATKHKSEDNPTNQDEDSLSAVTRERTVSDPKRKSAELKTNTR